MTATPPHKDDEFDHDAFVQAGERKRASSTGEMMHMVRTTRKWWMLPLIMVLVVLGLFLLIQYTGAGPLLYAIF